MAKMYQFTSRGVTKMREQAEELERKLQELDSQVADAAENGGNQWHDNFSYEQLTQQIRGVNHRLNEVHKVLRLVTVVEKPSGARVAIGTKVKLKINNKEQDWIICGYGESDPEQDMIAYNTPLAQIMLGKTIGDSAKGKLGGRDTEIQILGIEVYNE